MKSQASEDTKKIRLNCRIYWNSKATQSNQQINRRNEKSKKERKKDKPLFSHFYSCEFDKNGRIGKPLDYLEIQTRKGFPW